MRIPFRQQFFEVFSYLMPILSWQKLTTFAILDDFGPQNDLLFQKYIILTSDKQLAFRTGYLYFIYADICTPFFAL
jgi:hypothetical protein